MRLLAWAIALFLAAAAFAPASEARQDQRVGSVAVADLPPEARETIALIRSRGPFPYARDHRVFGNREGILPRQPRGYYREYTVRTPGERTRGARRIVAGRAGELYYTEDHYNSFRRIRE